MRWLRVLVAGTAMGLTACSSSVYAVDVNFTRGDPSGQGLISEVLVLHIAYLDRAAYLFNVCEY